MIKSSKQYRILGRSFSKAELRALSLEKMSVLGTPVWERDIWTFIFQWFSSEKTITVNTSGSTAVPKKIALLKENMLESAKATLSFFNLSNKDTALLCLPIKYIAGKMMIVRALAGGLDLHFIEPVSTPDITAIDHYSFSAMTPMQVVNMLQTDEGYAALGKIDNLIIGGSALPFGLNKKLQAFNTNIWHSYGMTETITHIALRSINGKNSSEWYQPLPGVKLRQDEKKCLVIEYPKIGIQHLATNDIVELNDRNQFKVLGRIDHVINSGGIKLFPEILERKIQGILPFNFFITGIPDPLLGDKLVLVREGGNISEEEMERIKLKVEGLLSGFEKPKAYLSIPQFHKTENGKVQRRKTLNLILSNNA